MSDSINILGTHPINLLKALDKVFEGEDWYAWEPEVVLSQLKEEVGDSAADKVLAVKSVAANTSLVFKNANAFENVVQAFCNNILVVDTFQPGYIEEIMYAVPQIIDIAKYVHGESIVPEFHGEIHRYVAASAKYRGWAVLPKRLAFAQDALDELTGLREDSKKYKEYETAIRLVKQLVENLHNTNLTKYKEVVEFIQQDTEDAVIARKIIGSYLYDPTLPFKHADK